MLVRWGSGRWLIVCARRLAACVAFIVDLESMELGIYSQMYRLKGWEKNEGR